MSVCVTQIYSNFGWCVDRSLVSRYYRIHCSIYTIHCVSGGTQCMRTASASLQYMFNVGQRCTHIHSVVVQVGERILLNTTSTTTVQAASDWTMLMSYYGEYIRLYFLQCVTNPWPTWINNGALSPISVKGAKSRIFTCSPFLFRKYMQGTSNSKL